jgi:hypothetical protein
MNPDHLWAGTRNISLIAIEEIDANLSLSTRTIHPTPNVYIGSFGFFSAFFVRMVCSAWRTCWSGRWFWRDPRFRVLWLTQTILALGGFRKFLGSRWRRFRFLRYARLRLLGDPFL